MILNHAIQLHTKCRSTLTRRPGVYRREVLWRRLQLPSTRNEAIAVSWNAKFDQVALGLTCLASNLPGGFPRDTAHDSVTHDPSSASTTRPAGDSATYSPAEGSRVPEASVAAQSALGGSAASREPASDEPQQTSTMKKMLGAVGLGTAATGAGVAASRAHDGAAPSTSRVPDQPTTTTGVDSYTSPTQSGPAQSGSGYSGPAPSHHRKESIPTTAYPAGIDSPSPISAPVGGTSATPGQEHKDHTGRNAGLAAAGVGAGSALGAHEYEKSRHRPDQTSGMPIDRDAPQTTTSSAVPSGYRQDNSSLGQDTRTPMTSAAAESERDSHGYGRTAAMAGAGAGAGALGAHEYEKRREPREESTGAYGPGPTQTTTSSSTPSTLQQESSAPRTGYQQGPIAPESERESHGYGRTAAATGVGAGAGAFGAHEYEKSREPREGTGLSSGPAGTQSTSSSAVPSGYQQDTYARSGAQQTPATTTEQEPTRESHGYGKTAAAAGLGAGAGAAGAYALHDRQPEDRSSDWPLRDERATAPATGAVPTSQRSAETYPAATSSQEPGYTQQARDTGATAAPYNDRQSRYEEPAQKHTARKEAATAGAAGPAATGSSVEEREAEQARADEEAERRRRREKEAALAGVAGAGAAGAGVHEHNKHQHEADEAGRQKALDEQEEARRKQYEKDQKVAAKEEKAHTKEIEKQEKAAAKAEKKEHKEMEKEEKKHQKEVEKEEKQQHKELEKQKTHDSKAAAADYEQQEKLDREERERHEKEAAAAAGLGATGAAAYGVHDKDSHSTPSTTTDDAGRTRLHKDPPEEKKPSLLKRLFGRRKNKDTGTDEDYEYDEGQEDAGHLGDRHHGAAGVGGAGAGTMAPRTAAATSESHDAPAGSYEAVSGGATKPSYNPFAKDKDDPYTAAGVPGVSAAADPDPTHDSSRQGLSQHGENVDNAGGPLASPSYYAEDVQKPGMATRAKDALKPLPER